VRDTDVNLYRRSRLEAEFGPFGNKPWPDGLFPCANDLVGETYRRVLAETTAIIRHQWRHEITHSALKGFLFHGGVGIGKTTMARRLSYELMREFGESDEHDDVVMVIIDGADIARGRYGDSEEQLRKLFQFAREGEFHGHKHEDDATRRTVLLFDDVESLFLARGSGGAREWHFSQNSVFFHAIDELDTSHTAVVLTTNRIDLVDEAIIDRFLPYEFSVPPKPVLLEIARHRAALQKLEDGRLDAVLKQITAEPVASLREVERIVTRTYVESILGHGQ
jgi:AAA+ superfamily predicted ATPase